MYSESFVYDFILLQQIHNSLLNYYLLFYSNNLINYLLDPIFLFIYSC